MNTFFATIMVIAIVILLILLIAASISLLIVFYFKDDRKNKFNQLNEEPVISVHPSRTDDGRPIRDRRSLESFCWIPTEFRTRVPTTDSNPERNINVGHTYFNPIFASTLQDKRRTGVLHLV